MQGFNSVRINYKPSKRHILLVSYENLMKSINLDVRSTKIFKHLCEYLYIYQLTFRNKILSLNVFMYKTKSENVSVYGLCFPQLKTFRLCKRNLSPKCTLGNARKSLLLSLIKIERLQCLFGVFESCASLKESGV